MSETGACQHHLSVPKTQKHMLPLIFFFFLFSFFFFKWRNQLLVDCCLLRDPHHWYQYRVLPFLKCVRKETSFYLPIAKANQKLFFHLVFFLFFFLKKVQFSIKISFLNYCFYWAKLMLLFSAPNKRDTGKRSNLTAK